MKFFRIILASTIFIYGLGGLFFIIAPMMISGCAYEYKYIETCASWPTFLMNHTCEEIINLPNSQIKPECCSKIKVYK